MDQHLNSNFNEKSRLLSGHCIPCEAGSKPLSIAEVKKYLLEVGGKWEQVVGVDGSIKKIRRRINFKDFKEAFNFVNKVADIAEVEGHHPDIFISYNKVILELSTHAISGLSQNDFILSSKIENMLK